MLRQLFKEDQMWIVQGLIVLFSQLCLKAIRKINNDVTFVSYSVPILWHQIKTIISFSYSKVLKRSFQKVQKYDQW